MKKEILAVLVTKVRQRLEAIEKNINAAQAAANEETKSSAGDKYETGRAMAQNDRDLYARQRIEVLRELETLQNIDPGVPQSHCIPGALITCGFGMVFIATSWGYVECQGQKVMVTSIHSPIGQALHGKTVGQGVSFRGKTVEIFHVE